MTISLLKNAALNTFKFRLKEGSCLLMASKLKAGEKFEGEIKVFFCLVMSRLVDCKLLFDFGLCTVLYNYLSTMHNGTYVMNVLICKFCIYVQQGLEI